MADPTDALLEERGKQHGDFTNHAQITQDLKTVMWQAPGWENLTSVQRESLEMIVHKIGRILAGNPNHRDHYDDIAGYARLVSQRLSPEAAQPIRSGVNVSGNCKIPRDPEEHSSGVASPILP